MRFRDLVPFALSLALFAACADDGPDCPAGFVASGDACLPRTGSPAAREALISGTVVTSREGDAPGAMVRLEGTGTIAFADPAGHFELAHGEEGSFTVVVEKAGYTPLRIPDLQLAFGEPLDLGELILRSATGALSGTVLLAGQSDHGGTLVFVEGAPQVSRTDAAGRFVLDGLPPGNAVVTAMHEGYGMASAAVQVQAAETLSLATLTLAPRAPEGVGRLVGTASLLGEQDHQGIEIRVTGGPEIERTTATDAAGDWAFDELPAGSYVLEARRDPWRPQRIDSLVIGGPGEIRAPTLVLRTSRLIDERTMIGGAAMGAEAALLRFPDELALFDDAAIRTLIPEAAELLGAGEGGALLETAAGLARFDGTSRNLVPLYPAPATIVAADDASAIYLTAYGRLMALSLADGSTRTLFETPADVLPSASATPLPAPWEGLYDVSLTHPALSETVHLLVDPARGLALPSGSIDRIEAGVLVHGDDGIVRLYDPRTGNVTGICGTDAQIFDQGRWRWFLDPPPGGGQATATRVDRATGTVELLGGVNLLYMTGSPPQFLFAFDDAARFYDTASSAPPLEFCSNQRWLWADVDVAWCLDAAGTLYGRSGNGPVISLAIGASNVNANGGGPWLSWTEGGRLKATHRDLQGVVRDLGPAGTAVRAKSDDATAVVVSGVMANGIVAVRVVDLISGDNFPLAALDAGTTIDACVVSRTGKTALCFYEPGGSMGACGNATCAAVWDRASGTAELVSAHGADIDPAWGTWSADERSFVTTYGRNGVLLRRTATGASVDAAPPALASGWVYDLDAEGSRFLVAWSSEAGLHHVDLGAGTDQFFERLYGRLPTGAWVLDGTLLDFSTGVQTPVGTGPFSFYTAANGTWLVDVAGALRWVDESGARLVDASCKIVPTLSREPLALLEWNGWSGELAVLGSDGTVRHLADDATTPRLTLKENGMTTALLVPTAIDADGRSELLRIDWQTLAATPFASGVPVSDPLLAHGDGVLLNGRIDGRDVLELVPLDGGAPMILGPRASWIEPAVRISFGARGAWWVADPSTGSSVAVDLESAANRGSAVGLGGSILYGGSNGGTWSVELPR